MNPTIFNLFPTPVASYQLGRDLTPQEHNHIQEALQQTRPNEGNRTTQQHFILNNPELHDLRQFCLDAIKNYGQTIFQYQDGNPTITQSWVNISQKGQWHHLHNHPNSLWSGVFYIKTGPEDRIHFHKHDNWQNETDLQTIEFNAYNSKSWWLPVSTSELLVFPSSLKHRVAPITTDERISLSFNTYPTTPIGTIENLTYLDPIHKTSTP